MTAHQICFCMTHGPCTGGCTLCQKNKHIKNIVAAFRGMHVSPAKHSSAWLPRECDYRTDRHTDRQDRRMDRQTDAGQSDPYVPLCFAGDTKKCMLPVKSIKRKCDIQVYGLGPKYSQMDYSLSSIHTE